MTKRFALSLQSKAEEAGREFSRKTRAKNTNGETFTLEHIKPFSDCVAAGIYKKSPSGKRAVFVFCLIDGGSGPYWIYFVPTDSHILGLMRIADLKASIENENFAYNFIEELAAI